MNNTGNFLKKGKIFYRSIAVGLVIITIVEAVIAVLLHLYMQNDQMKSIKNLEENEIGRVSVYIESMLKPLISTAAYFSEVTLFSDNTENTYFDEKNINNNLQFYRITHDYVNGVLIATGDEQIAYGNISYSEYKRKTLYTNYNIRVEYPVKDEWPHSFWVIHENKSDINRKVVIEVNAVTLASNIFFSGDNRKCYVVSDEGDIFFSSDFKNINSNINDILPKLEVKENDIVSSKTDGDSVYITSSKLEDYNLTVICITSFEAYRSLRKERTYTLTLMVAVSFVVMTFVFLFIIKRTYKPIEDVVESLQYHLLIDLEQYGDEIIFINDCISNTLQNNDDLRRQLNTNIQLLHKFQIQALQSQINPHFLYNTIDALKWLSFTDLSKENYVEKGLVNLKDVISVSLDMRNVVHTLNEELKITEKYCELISLRYGGKIDFIREIDGSLLNAYVPKLIIQPIIENSINHGVYASYSEAVIKIAVYKNEDGIVIEISDNGQGIPEDRVSAIRKSLKEDLNAVSKHIGLKNVHKRIQLLYGEQYGLTISSVYGSGTVCRIILPGDKT